MSAVNLVSLLCLALTGMIASWGIFSRHFDDSLMQRIGLSTVALACLLRIPEKVRVGAPDTPPELLLAQIGLLIYAIGTVLKLWHAKRHMVGHRERRWRGERAHN